MVLQLAADALKMALLAMTKIMSCFFSYVFVFENILVGLHQRAARFTVKRHHFVQHTVTTTTNKSCILLDCENVIVHITELVQQRSRGGIIVSI